jgi:hypothetical protein
MTRKDRTIRWRGSRTFRCCLAFLFYIDKVKFAILFHENRRRQRWSLIIFTSEIQSMPIEKSAIRIF